MQEVFSRYPHEQIWLLHAKRQDPILTREAVLAQDNMNETSGP